MPALPKEVKWFHEWVRTQGEWPTGLKPALLEAFGGTAQTGVAEKVKKETPAPGGELIALD
jgi:hypothetical protein